MMKSVSIAAVIAVALIPATASAELPNGAVLTFDELKIQEGGGGFVEPSTPDALRQYLNMAHCMCAKDNLGMETQVQYLVRSSADTDSDKPVNFYVGTDCGDEIQRPMKCRAVASLNNIDLLVAQPQRVEFNIFDVFMGGNDMTIPEACTADIEGDRSVFAIVDINGDNTPEYAEGIPFGTTDVVTRIDTKPPPLATNFEGASAENAIRLTWDPPDTTTDIFAYQALCARADGSPAFSERSNAPRYTRVRDLCGLDADAITVSATELVSVDTTTATIPADMAALDPAFICGETTASTAGELFIQGLDNDVPYSILLLAVDQHGNAVGVSFDKTVTPRIAYDFWEDLHNRGSNVEGGFCLAGTQSPGGTAGPLALALGWILLRRRRRAVHALARVAPIAALFVVFGGVHVASAQGTTPYWEQQQEEDARLADEDLVKWHVGLRLGPYTPEIDKQFGMDPGPYNEMFGGYQVLPMLDIDRIVWTGFGQLGFGGTLGYMQKTAKAWAEAMPGEDRVRSSGDTNTFRLFPIAATAVYRFTWLDDNYGIPVVPYIRGGVSYYLWWFKTNGKTSKACWDGSDTPDCDADKAYGATIGVQGAIGIAIRAERVDSAAATSMRAGGIEHAGFYGELSLAKVDGFGSEYKLSVGDATWFAGVDFEF